MLKRNIFILGGARSGKSFYAQGIATHAGKRVLFCATAEPLDEEMQHRITEHKRSRPKEWDTLEASIGTGQRINEVADKYDTVIIDCITLLISNVMGSTDGDDNFETKATEEINDVIACMKNKPANFIIVSNELGMGLVPPNEMGRDYRDVLGKMNQMLAINSDEVYFMIAGIPMRLK